MSVADPSITNPFLSGPWTPVDDELDLGPLRVDGPIPDGLVGTYMRNGPNPAFPPVGRYHLFDGDGMVHAVEFRDGQAHYRNRYIDSRGLRAERRAGRALYGGLAEFHMPDPDVIAEAGMLKNTGNTHLIRHAGRLFALMEAAKPTELTLNLETLGEYDYRGALHGPMTAHPKIDPATGEMVFFGYSPLAPYLRVSVASPDGALTFSEPIELPAPVMMHDFVVTAGHIVLFDLPAVFDLQAMLAGGTGISWRPDNGARIGVMDRGDLAAGVRWLEVEPFWAFHFLNGYDDGADSIVAEGCRAPRLNFAFGKDHLDAPSRPLLHRWHIDLARGLVTDEPLDDRPGDFPRINDNLAGSRTRYGYTAQAATWLDDDVRLDTVTKYDLADGTSTTHHYGPGRVSGEAAFAPDPSGNGEDDGWLLNFVYDTSTDQSMLVILDARTLERVASVDMPRRVPSGFHGQWLPESA